MSELNSLFNHSRRLNNFLTLLLVLIESKFISNRGEDLTHLFVEIHVLGLLFIDVLVDQILRKELEIDLKTLVLGIGLENSRAILFVALDLEKVIVRRHHVLLLHVFSNLGQISEGL